MQFQLYSQLLKLDLSNDDLLQMYYVLYYDLKQEDKDMAENIAKLIEIREKAKIELRKLLFNIKNSIQASAVGTAVLNFLPVFLKLDYLARNTFNNLNLKVCYEKEKKNIKLYYQTLYNQDIPSSTLDVLFKHKNKLESLP
ncbi:hypothetical protein OQ279_10985 [Salinimicrobium sp. MT39]|uniref:Uncharacterized protein n=2 Tax=Salinimicrobium TaxID=561367 RepID=A0A9X3I1P5_9FLAO|nr:hypothetical protein [Salinimicrobium profundisediminis]MCX2838673.1 hypothetical protein [Salinimicrobium profundisediminis]